MRSRQIDFLKGVAIMAVIMYHAKLFTYGYLGVDIFFVIAGFFTTRSVVRALGGNSFGYLSFLRSRLVRLWPLVLLVSGVSLFLGYYFMLPMAYKNTCETVVGSSTFLNNFVQFVTSSNYWDGSNDYKPLMHTWYLGVLMQFYFVFPLLMLFAHKVGGGKMRYMVGLLIIIVAFSLTFYLLPHVSTAQKFYLLPARLFEFALGGLLVFRGQIRRKSNQLLAGLFLLSLILLVSANWDMEVAQMRLLLTVMVSTCFLAFVLDGSAPHMSSRFLTPVVYVGKASLSFYLWHQVVLAFYRYIFNDELHLIDYLIVFLVCSLLAAFSYELIEKRLLGRLNNKKLQIGTIIICVLLSFFLFFPSAWGYSHHGLVRDVPELDLYVGRDNNLESQDYNNRIYAMDCDFPDSGKRKVLVAGDSFARDWVNVLLEAGVDSVMDISYHADTDSELEHRIEQADVIFVSTNAPFERYWRYLPRMLSKKFWRVGIKNFGTRNGIVYNNDRYGKDYFSQTIQVTASIEQLNNTEKGIFGKHYIDVMTALRLVDGSIPVFTPSHGFYSHDGLHLTRAGAKELARRLDVIKMMEI